MKPQILGDIIREQMEINRIMEEDQKANDIQAGGSHYKEMAVQPWTVMQHILTEEEFIGYLKGNIIKYGMRQGRKDSPDADKCQHYIKKLEEYKVMLGWD